VTGVRRVRSSVPPIDADRKALIAWTRQLFDDAAMLYKYAKSAQEVSHALPTHLDQSRHLRLKMYPVARPLGCCAMSGAGASLIRGLNRRQHLIE
jgi:hypothetical protein